MSTLGAFFVFFAITVFYLLPSIIAAIRNVRHGGWLFTINLFFGWTILGWIAVLIWAVAETPIPRRKSAHTWSQPFYEK